MLIKPALLLRRVFGFLVAAYFFFFAANDAYPMPYLVLDNDGAQAFPKRFRILKNNGLRAIGSGQFTHAQLLRIKNQINAPIIVVDLRKESHGFVAGMPISWFGFRNWANKNKLPDAVEEVQRKLLLDIKNKATIRVHTKLHKEFSGAIKPLETVWLQPREVASEEELVRALGLRYKRFYVTDHMAPDKLQVQAFEDFIKTVPADTWLYFHCRGGSGRTSTFMVLYEILRNGRKKTLEQILKRQMQRGGKDLSQFPAANHYKYVPAIERFKLIKEFYLHHS